MPWEDLDYKHNNLEDLQIYGIEPDKKKVHEICKVDHEASYKFKADHSS